MTFETTATTNSVVGSCIETKVGVRLCFDDLWQSHPLNDVGEVNLEFRSHPCRSPKAEFSFPGIGGAEIKKHWPEDLDNQCAVKMSVALQKAGIEMSPKLSKGVRFCSAIYLEGKKHSNPYHAVSATELAGWLVSVLGKPKKYPGADARSLIGTRKGILFFEDFWARTEAERASGAYTGDHIDLWNGQHMPGADHSQRGNLNYFERSRLVWFWELQ